MNRFHIIEGAAVILSRRGVYRQAKAYRRGPDIYASHGTGFIKLSGMGGTTVPDISWYEIEGDGIEQTGTKRPTWTGETE